MQRRVWVACLLPDPCRVYSWQDVWLAKYLTGRTYGLQGVLQDAWLAGLGGWGMEYGWQFLGRGCMACRPWPRRGYMAGRMCGRQDVKRAGCMARRVHACEKDIWLRAHAGFGGRGVDAWLVGCVGGRM
eukprot:534431-Pelagomonas_calceolata.AAC.3